MKVFYLTYQLSHLAFYNATCISPSINIQDVGLCAVDYVVLCTQILSH